MMRDQPVTLRRRLTAPTRGTAPRAAYMLGGLLALPFLFGSNALLATATITAGLFILFTVWRHAETQVLLFVCGYQWLQVFAPIVQAQLAGEELESYLGGSQFVAATWLSLIGVVVFSVGVSFAAKKIAPQRTRLPKRPSLALNQHVLLATWGGILVADALFSGPLRIPGITTAWQPVSMLRMGAALLLFETVFSRNRGWSYLTLVVVVETVIGFLGYFSGFKVVFIVLLLASGNLLARGRAVALPFVAAASSLLVLVLVWQAVKVEYREFVSSGKRKQIVIVSREERLDYLLKAVSELDGESFSEASETTLRRLGYVTFFGHCLQNVPRNVPHTDGRLWFESVTHILMPRLLFPNKKALHDSERTNRYSGIRVAGVKEGASIGIGYIGESYIDFGVPLMFLPIGLFGLAVGAAYGLLLKRARHRGIGVAIGLALCLSGNFLLESSNAKMVGSLVSAFAVYIVLLEGQRRFAPRWGPLFKPSAATTQRRAHASAQAHASARQGGRRPTR